MSHTFYPILLLDIAVKASLLLLVVFLGVFCLRKCSAATRHSWWTLGFVGCLVIPVITLFAPTWTLPILPDSFLRVESVPDASPSESSDRFAKGPPVPSTDSHRSSPLRSQPPQANIDTPSTRLDEQPFSNVPSPVIAPAANSTSLSELSASSFSWPHACLVLWSIGVLVCWMRTIGQHLSLRRVLSRCAKLSSKAWNDLIDTSSHLLGLQQKVTLLKHDKAQSPMIAGLWQARVILPSDADNWQPEHRRLVLLHELAHAKRRDVLTQALARFVCGLYWFNPLCWYGLFQMRQLRELACDDLVLSSGQRPVDYAELLLDVARSYQHRSYSTAVSMAHNSNVESRILAILDKARSRVSLSPRMARALLGLAIAFVLLIGSVRLESNAEPPTSSDATKGNIVDSRANAPELESSKPASNKPVSEEDEKKAVTSTLLDIASKKAAAHQQAIHTAHLKFWLTRMSGPFKADTTPDRCAELLSKYDLVERPNDLRALLVDLLDFKDAPANKIHQTPWSEMELHFANHTSLGTRIRVTRHWRGGSPDIHILDRELSVRWDEANSQLNVTRRKDNRYGITRPAEFWRPLVNPERIAKSGADIRQIGSLLSIGSWANGSSLATVDANTGFFQSTDRGRGNVLERQRWLGWTMSHDGIPYPKVVTKLRFTDKVLTHVEFHVVQEARFNLPLPDSVFRLGAPAGSVIVDGRAEQKRSRKINRDIFDATSEEEVLIATKPVQEAFTQTEKDAFAALRRLYVLEEGEVIRYFGPPHPIERKYLPRMLAPGYAPTRRTRLPQCNLLIWKNGELAKSPMLGVSPFVSNLISVLIEQPSTDLDIPKSLLDTVVPGDYLYRPEATPEEKASALSAILSHRLGRSIKLSFQNVERTIYTAHGTLKIEESEVSRYEERPLIAIHGGEHPGDHGEVIGFGNTSRLLKNVGNYLGTRVLDETTPDKQKLAWSKRWYDLKTTPDEKRFKIDPQAVLQKVEEQTGIRFEEGRQSVRVLRLEQ